MHASPIDFRYGDRVLCPDESRLPPRSWGPSLPSAIEGGQYRTDRVYVFDPGDVEVGQLMGYFQFTGAGVSIYEVEPMGELEIDPDVTTQNHQIVFRCCPSAKVVCRLWPLVTTVDE